MEEIHEEREHRGEEKAETTVCHHVNVLKMPEWSEFLGSKKRTAVRGSTISRIRGSSPTPFWGRSKETLATAQETTTEELSDLIETLYEQHGDDIDSAVREMKPASTVRPDMKSFSSVSRSTRSLLELSETGTLNDLLTGGE